MNLLTGILVCSIFFTGCSQAQPDALLDQRVQLVDSGESSEQKGKVMDTTFEHFTVTSTVRDVIQHPAFDGFGQFILPLDRGYQEKMPLKQLRSLLPYHNNIDPQRAVDTINYMVDEVAKEQTTFYDIYSEEEKQSDPTKKNTGLFFFRGEPNAPFAIVCPGGGFSYVGSIHEGFPHAIELSKKGYNAFVIQYRVGGAQAACEDLAAAISFVFENAEALQVKTDGYSLWGGSAGARMAAYLGSYGPEAFGGAALPKPGCVVMEYTGYTDYTDEEPPTFVVVGENDGIANWRTMESRINTLASMGVNTEFHKYPNLGHGFGLGIGTTAEGWLDLAVSFWEKEM